MAAAFVVTVGLYALYRLVVSEIPAGQREVPLKDVLTTVLAIAAIGIATFGVGAYFLLPVKIEANVRERTERSAWTANVIQSVDSGWLYWNLYQLSKRKPLPARKPYLQQAIEETTRACSWIHQYLYETEYQVEKLLAIALNNRAFYIYEQDLAGIKTVKADKTVALKCVEYIEQRVTKFP